MRTLDTRTASESELFNFCRMIERQEGERYEMIVSSQDKADKLKELWGEYDNLKIRVVND